MSEPVGAKRRNALPITRLGDRPSPHSASRLFAFPDAAVLRPIAAAPWNLAFHVGCMIGHQREPRRSALVVDVRSLATRQHTSSVSDPDNLFRMSRLSNPSIEPQASQAMA